MLTPFVPFPPVDGGRIRIYELLKGLSARNSVDVLTLFDGTPETRVAVEQLRREGFDVEAVVHNTSTVTSLVRSLRLGRSFYGARFASAAFAAALDRRLASHAYEVVQCEFAYTAQYARTGRNRRTPAWVLDSHNVEFRLNERLAENAMGLRGAAYRLYAGREQRLRRAEELSACLRVDRVVAVSSVDRDALRGEMPDLDVDVVPNGVDLDHFAPSSGGESDRPPSAVFTGKMDYRPNVDAVEWFCSDILPLVRTKLPQFSFTICGGPTTRSVRNLAALPGVRVSGQVVDTRPFIDEAAVVAVPLRAGSGTRLKILEAMAMARPVVATTLAAEGIEATDSLNMWIADTPADFADAVVQLVTDPVARRRLGHAARKLVERRYGWNAVVAQYEAVYADLLNERVAEVSH